MADLLVNLHRIRAAQTGETINFEGILSNPNGDLQLRDPNTNSGNPVTLSQLFAGGSGHTTFIEHDDTPLDYTSSALKFLRVNAAGDAVEFVTVTPSSTFLSLSDTPNPFVADRIPFANATPDALIYDDEVRGLNVQSAEPCTSGVIGQFDGQISVSTGTDILCASGNAGLAFKPNSKTRERFLTTWGTQPKTIGAPVLAEPFGVVVAEDPGKTGTATIDVVTAGTATPDYLRSRARLGYTFHEGGVLVDVIDVPDTVQDAIQSVDDLWDAIGVRKEAGTGVHTEIAASLTSSITATTLIGRNINFRQDPNNPNRAIRGSVPLAVFDTVASDGTVFATAISAFPKTWNNAGVQTPLTGQSAAITQVVRYPNNKVIAQLGTTAYANFGAALDSLTTELLSNPLSPVAQQLGERLSYVIISNQATVWASNLAEIFPVGGSAGSGGGAGSKSSEIKLTVSSPIQVGNNQGNLFVPRTARSLEEILLQSGALTSGSGGTYQVEVSYGVDLATQTPAANTSIAPGGERGTNTLGSPVLIPANSVVMLNVLSIGEFPIGTDVKHKKLHMHLRWSRS